VTERSTRLDLHAIHTTKGTLLLEKLLGPFIRRWPWLRTALDVQQRFSDVRGNYLAAAVALNVFIAIFPLLLVAIAIIGLVTENNTEIVTHMIDTLGITGTHVQDFNNILTRASETKKAASIIGVIGLLWTGLGVVAAIEYALDATWQVTGRGIKDKGRGLVWGVGALVILGGSVALTTAVDIVANGFVLNTLTIVGALIINFAFWMWTFWVLSYHRVAWRAYVPGALMAAVGLEIIKQLFRLVPALAGHSTLYGPLGIVFSLLAALVLFARLIVYASTLNVIKWERRAGTVAVEVDVPRIPGQAPLEADRAGAVEPTD
jgi:membrane protein